jgi:hypothetical protein
VQSGSHFLPILYLFKKRLKNPAAELRGIFYTLGSKNYLLFCSLTPKQSFEECARNACSISSHSSSLKKFNGITNGFGRALMEIDSFFPVRDTFSMSFNAP